MADALTTNRARALGLGPTAQKVVERFLMISQDQKFECKTTPVDTRCTCRLDNNNVYSIEIDHLPQGLQRWAALLHKLQQTGNLDPSDFKQCFFDFPKEYLELSDEDLVSAVYTDLSRRFANTDTINEQEKQLRELTNRIINQHGAETLGKNGPEVKIWHEQGQLTYSLGNNLAYEIGRLSVLAELMESDLIHTAGNHELSQALINYQKALEDGKLTSEYNGMLCAEYERDPAGNLLSGGYVIQSDGTRREQDTILRLHATDDPQKKGIQVWFNVRPDEIMVSYVKLSADSPVKFIVNKRRTHLGTPEKPTREQHQAINQLLAQLRATWNSQVDFSTLDAYLNMIGEGWEPELTARPYQLPDAHESSTQDDDKTKAKLAGLRKTAESLQKRVEAINQAIKLDENRKVHILTEDNRYHVSLGKKIYAVHFNNKSEPLFQHYNEIELAMLRRFVQAYEIMSFQSMFAARDNQPTEAATEGEAAKTVAELTEEQAQIADKFREYQLEINSDPRNLMIVFEDKRYPGVYLSLKRHACYFELTQTDFDEFLGIISKKPSSTAASDTADHSVKTDDTAKDGAATSVEVADDSHESSVPGQYRMVGLGNKAVPVRNITSGNEVVVPSWMSRK